MLLRLSVGHLEEGPRLAVHVCSQNNMNVVKKGIVEIKELSVTLYYVGRQSSFTFSQTQLQGHLNRLDNCGHRIYTRETDRGGCIG